MKIKKLLLPLVAITLTQATLADSGIINFQGQVVEDSCTTAVGGGTSPTVVTLPTVLTTALDTAGKVAGESAPFNFSVSGCDASVAARGVHFSLTSTSFDTTNNDLLANTTADGATNVGIEILEGGAAIPFAGAANRSKDITIASGAGTSDDFTAQYKATGVATAGAVTASMNWDLVYN
ncbi:fimbrial protein [Acinetobacter johnsonii]|uniref:fimbrial protein n=1 Tax=Acinetobacter johnsonii TaxID=40214 RepID=UPI00216A3CD8|nr:fimbrial protein [Acinetobacter johnsonii]MCS3527814.1 major type 1 subunit fimbrin (pilin) [Acinetobacter johnsonii]